MGKVAVIAVSDRRAILGDVLRNREATGVTEEGSRGSAEIIEI